MKNPPLWHTPHRRAFHLIAGTELAIAAQPFIKQRLLFFDYRASRSRAPISPAVHIQLIRGIAVAWRLHPGYVNEKGRGWDVNAFADIERHGVTFTMKQNTPGRVGKSLRNERKCSGYSKLPQLQIRAAEKLNAVPLLTRMLVIYPV